MHHWCAEGHDRDTRPSLAGGRNVAASLWPVDNDATVVTVRRFYEVCLSMRDAYSARALFEASGGHAQ